MTSTGGPGTMMTGGGGTTKAPNGMNTWEALLNEKPAPCAIAGKAPRVRMAARTRRPIAESIAGSPGLQEAPGPDRGKSVGQPAAAGRVIHHRGRGQQGWGNLQL